jgi:hypothetical protein
MAKIRKEMLDEATGGSGGGGGAGDGFDVKKAGDTRVGLVGFPSVGKSTLLTTLTGTFSEAASYEFTTLTAIPGTLKYRGAKIQVHRRRARSPPTPMSLPLALSLGNLIFLHAPLPPHSMHPPSLPRDHQKNQRQPTFRFWTCQGSSKARKTAKAGGDK